MEIKNVIFDCGQVLVRFEPDYIIGPSVTDPDDRELLVRVLFDHFFWKQLDKGTIDETDVIAETRDRIPPRLHDAAENAMRYWYRRLPEMPGMSDLIDSLLASGKKLCLLSNISKRFVAHADEIPILSRIENRVFSSTCGLTKPDPAIFRYTCEKFGLVPEETIFIDDNPDNIAGAAGIGLQTFLFDGDTDRLARALAE